MEWVLLKWHCAPSHYGPAIHNYFLFDPQIFFYAIATFWAKKAIESNLLTKDKIERHGTKVEKTPQIGDSFKIHTKILIQSSYFKNYTYLVS